MEVPLRDSEGKGKERKGSLGKASDTKLSSEATEVGKVSLVFAACNQSYMYENENSHPET